MGSQDANAPIAIKEIADLSPTERTAVFDRDAGIEGARADAQSILKRVREEGDVALRDLSREFDDVEVANIDVTADAERAVDEVPPDVLTAVRTSIENVREFHEEQRPSDWTREFGEGRSLGRRFRPLERVGVYVPGGAAAYPSSAVMGIVPAKVAGVEHVAVTTPPADQMNPVTLAAISEAGADAVYSVGGAQAVGALAYGTETVDAVQKIVGPGNRWVTAAKAEVRGDVEIDFLAGPSEILVLADGTADPGFVAADLLAQAEHDPNAAAAAVTADGNLAESIQNELRTALANRQRSDTIREALGNPASGVFMARSMSEATLFTQEYAAEHLSIQASDEEALLDRISNAGSVFLGPYTPVAAGDYASGTNHVLPTNGKARLVGGLSVDTFLRSSTVQRLTYPALEDLSKTITTLAEAEGLEAHAASVRTRLDDGSHTDTS